MSKDSKYYCVNLFAQIATDNAGYYRPCCQYKRFLRDPTNNNERYHASQYSLEEFNNSTAIKELRKKVQNDEPVPGCEYCYNLEACNAESMRQRHNREHQDLIEIVQDNLQQNKTYLMDLRLGNLCNLGCIMCSPHVSSFINKEWAENGVDNFTNTFLLLDESKSDFPVETWHKSEKLIDSIVTTGSEVKRMWLLGGEPLINKQSIKVLKSLIGRGKNLELEVSTNVTFIDDDLLDLLQNFDTVIKCSIDGINEFAEYIRYPSHFNSIESNFIKLLKSGMRIETVFSVSIINLFHIVEFYNWFMELHRKYSPQNSSLSVGNIVVTPEHLSVAHLPMHIKEKAARLLEPVINELNNLENSPMDPSTFINLHSYLLTSKSEPDKIRQGWKFLENLDKIRHKNWKDVAPWMEEVLTLN